MMRGLLVCVALGAGGCDDRLLLTQQSPVVSLAPRVLDVGDILLGTEAVGALRVDVRYGPVDVLDVNVLDVLGDGFAFEGPEPFTVDDDAVTVLDIVFRPTVVGPASALVQVALDAGLTPLPVEVRGRAVLPELRAEPAVVDFGAVRAGETREEVVQLENVGTADLEVTAAFVGDPTVTFGATFPLAIARGGTADVALTFAPTSEARLATGVSFAVGTYRTPELVLLRGNDCANGLPEAYDRDGDGVSSCARDCDDTERAAFPGANEVADGLDNDCDGVVDEGTARFDDDFDGYCEDPTSCEGTAKPGDCADHDPAIHPGAREVDFDGLDNDCDGTVDRGGLDADGDGYGPSAGDCDDLDPDRHPGAVEVANGADDDCDSKVDEGTEVTDDDGDGWCESLSFCFGGKTPGDCADADPTRHPGAPELPNFIDDDCDGEVDEGTDQGDDDGDGFTEVGGDCDDADPDVNPARGNCP